MKLTFKRGVAFMLGVAAALSLIGCKAANYEEYSTRREEASERLEAITSISGADEEVAVSSDLGKLSRSKNGYINYEFENIVIPIPKEYASKVIVTKVGEDVIEKATGKKAIVEEEELVEEAEASELDKELEKIYAISARHTKELISVYEKESVVYGQEDHPGKNWGDGLLFTIAELDRIGFEYLASNDWTGVEVVARNKEKDLYYVMYQPVDVRFFRSQKIMDQLSELSNLEPADIDSGKITQAEIDAQYNEVFHDWNVLCDWAYQVLPYDIAYMNDGVEYYAALDMTNTDGYLYKGEHKKVACYLDEAHEDVLYLYLSQPATKGDKGIWCVEKVENYYTYHDEDGAHSDIVDSRYVFPVMFGIENTADIYYTEAQLLATKGNENYVYMMSPMEVAIKYTQSPAWYYGEIDPASLVIVDSASVE